MFYGNKSSTLQNFTTSVLVPPGMENSVMVDLKPVASTIEGGAQKQQLVDVECKDIFFVAPKLEIKFR